MVSSDSGDGFEVYRKTGMCAIFFFFKLNGWRQVILRLVDSGSFAGSRVFSVWIEVLVETYFIYCWIWNLFYRMGFLLPERWHDKYVSLEAETSSWTPRSAYLSRWTPVTPAVPNCRKPWKRSSDRSYAWRPIWSSFVWSCCFRKDSWMLKCWQKKCPFFISWPGNSCRNKRITISDWERWNRCWSSQASWNGTRQTSTKTWYWCEPWGLSHTIIPN